MFKKYFQFLLSILIFTSCASNLPKNYLSAKGKILKSYPIGKHKGEIVIISEDNDSRIIKYKIFSSEDLSHNAINIKVIHFIDKITKTCFSGISAQSKISCDELKNDPDMKDYI